jgi:hypothetical protein
MNNTEKIYNYTETLDAFNKLSKWFDLSNIYTITFTDHNFYMGGVKLQGHYNNKFIRTLKNDLSLEIIEAPKVAKSGYIEAVFKYENINFYVTLT